MFTHWHPGQVRELSRYTVGKSPHYKVQGYSWHWEIFFLEVPMEKPGVTVWHVLVWGTVGIPIGRVRGYAKQHCVCVAPILDVSLASIAIRDLTLVFLPGGCHMLESLQMSSFSNLSYFDRI